MKNLGAIVLVVGVLLIGYIVYEKFFKTTGIHQHLIPESECNVETKVFAANDDHMSGVIDNGQEFDVALNWYKCHAVERGDVVLYKFSNTKDPVARFVRGVPGDRFKLVRAPGHWNVEIDGDVLESSDGRPYVFGSDVSPVLSLYEKSSKGILDADTALVFSRHSPGGFDSGVFGAVSIQDIIGKVDLKSVRAGSGSATKINDLVKEDEKPAAAAIESAPTATPAPPAPAKKSTAPPVQKRKSTR